MRCLAATRARASLVAAACSLRAALALAVLCPAVAKATSFSWTSTGGRFDFASNWIQSGAPVDLDGIPDANDTAAFDRGNVSQYSVVFGNLLVPGSDIHPIVDKVVVGNNPLSFAGFHGSTLTVDSTNFTETARGVVIGSGAGDMAALTSTLATFDTQYATLGSAAGSSGTLNLTSASEGAFSVSGTGATYDLIVGLNGTGAINVSNGRDVTVADDAVLGQNATGVGNVSISGAGSTWTDTGDLKVGGAGSGTLNVSGGADIAVGGVVLVGTNGTVNFSDTSSTWSSGQVLLDGTFNIANGATLSSTDVIVSGTLAVTGVDSSWTTSSNTEPSGGTVNISNGGQVLDLANSLFPPLSATPSGSVNVNVSSGGSLTTGGGFTSHASMQPGRRVSVTGANSVWRSNVGQLDVFTGEITVSNGGRFEYVGEVRVDGGDVAVRGTGAIMQPIGVGVINITGSGTLTVSDGGTVLGPLFVERSANGAGTLKGNGNVGGFVDSDGIIAPGDLVSVGALHVLSDCSFRPAGTLQIKLGGTTPESEHDQLLVTNMARLQGTLEVTLVNAFVPSVGQTFTILTADNLDGTFGTEAMPPLPDPSLAFDVIYNAQSVVLAIVPALPGDYNGDGTVDAADYVLWRENNGTAATLPNDSTPGMVTAADYDVWRAHFGQTAGNASGSSARAGELVPEPTVFAQLILVLAGCTLYIRWHAATKRDRCQYAPQPPR